MYIHIIVYYLACMSGEFSLQSCGEKTWIHDVFFSPSVLRICFFVHWIPRSNPINWHLLSLLCGAKWLPYGYWDDSYRFRIHPDSPELNCLRIYIHEYSSTKGYSTLNNVMAFSPVVVSPASPGSHWLFRRRLHESTSEEEIRITAATGLGQGWPKPSSARSTFGHSPLVIWRCGKRLWGLWVAVRNISIEIWNGVFAPHLLYAGWWFGTFFPIL